MKFLKLSVIAIFFLSLLIAACAQPEVESEAAIETAQEDSDRLAVVWTSGEKDVAIKMVFMYVDNGKRQGWWDEIQLIVWGPSSKLLSEDKDIQDYVKRMMTNGVEIVACKACADSYGVSDKLTELGLEVKYMGKPLTDLIKSDWHVVTF
ncbi:DsrE family protein [candidate division KSB1 bacterium]